MLRGRPMHTTTALAALLFAAAASCQAGGAPPASVTVDLHARFDKLLADNVRGERVDYLKVRDGHFSELTAYLHRLDGIELQRLSREDRLALLINLYNATMIKVVAERYTPGWTPAQDEFAVFDEKLVRLGGELISLNELEHQRIRRDFDEPRIHVALVCAARSCPPLLPRAYSGSDLTSVLEAKMRAFVNDRTRNRIGSEKVELSKIFEWYRDDFADTEAGLLRYLSKYAGEDLAGREVGHLEYSWQPNILAPAGEWVTTADEKRPVEVVGRDGGRLRLRRPFGKGEFEVAADAAEPVRFGG